MWARRSHDSRHLHGGGCFDLDGAGTGTQRQADLAAASQLDIDLGEKLRVEQGAVLDPLAAVDPEARAQGVEAVLGAGVPGASQDQGIDHAAHADRVARTAPKLVIEETEVEGGIVRYQGR